MKYTYTDLVDEFKLVSDTGDMWGEAMSTLFTVAADIYMRDAYCIPEHWGYNPGAAEDPRETDDYFGVMCAHTSVDDLVRFGNLLERYSSCLARHGHSY